MRVLNTAVESVGGGAGRYRGVLRARESAKKFRLERYAPSPEIAPFVERYWVVEWDLRGEPPHTQETLPNPCVNVVFEAGTARAFGIQTYRFSRLLEEWGRVFGIKFRPGGFFPFYQRPVSTLLNRAIPLAQVFGNDVTALETTIERCEDHQEMIRATEGFLMERLPPEDERVRLIDRIVERAASHGAITHVADLAAEFNLSVRSLQRLFHRYVGVGPKWVISRFRMQEAVARIEDEGFASFAQLAHELGYFDQAHFVREFKRIVGESPREYGAHMTPHAATKTMAIPHELESQHGRRRDHRSRRRT